MNNKMLYIVLALVAFLIAGVVFFLIMTKTRNTEPSVITRDEAIKIAEKFVLTQGYTETPVKLTLEEIVGEPLQRGGDDVNKILSLRKGTLLPHAVGALGASTGEQESWTIGFRYRVPIDPKYGRAVLVSNGGATVRMIHKDLDLSYVNENK